jgi:heme/copper-type cytochrome/quinol oxidase subunit 2
MPPLSSSRIAAACRSRRGLWAVVARMVLTVALIGLLAGAASACPTCKIALESQDEQAARLMNGYFWSIVFMMSMPFVVLGSMGTLLYHEVRKARAQQATAAARPPLAYPLGASPTA